MEALAIIVLIAWILRATRPTPGSQRTKIEVMCDERYARENGWSNDDYRRYLADKYGRGHNKPEAQMTPSMFVDWKRAQQP